MRVLWVSEGAIREDAQGGMYSSTASTRYRVLMPARELSKKGWHSHIIQMHRDMDPMTLEDPHPEDFDILVVSKIFNPAIIEWVKKFQKSSRPVVVDLCDDHFDGDYGALHRQLLELADLVTANTFSMARRIMEVSERKAEVIPDPLEGKRRPSRFRPSPQELHLLWFGSDIQISTIGDYIPQLKRLANHARVCLELISIRQESMLPHIEEFNRRNSPFMSLRYIPWEYGVTEERLARCDAVILPSKNKQKYQVKSANRVVLSLWNGRFTSAWNLPEYRQFSQWIHVGEDLVSGLLWALRHPKEAEAGVRLAQDYIEERFSPEYIGRIWFDVLRDLGSGVSKVSALKEKVEYVNSDSEFDMGLRLNLGCGDKILPGYLNVDVVSSRIGQRPDIVSDLHCLPFPDRCADEILAVHVVEHFWRWEVVDVLKEWVRVLKPGGKMILECPNIKSACEAFLVDPEKYAGPGPESQKTLWVFYGDPRWRDPLMVHKWGYTPESLAEVMKEAGVKEIRQEPAQFKLREPRDMRVVGII